VTPTNACVLHYDCEESIMGTEFKARWGAAMGLAAASVIVAIAALVFIASPAFTEATASYVRVALAGIAPILAILAVASAAQASSRVLKTPWPAALIAVVGSVATSVAYELWYVGVDSTPASPAPMLVVATASVVLNGTALAVLVRPALRQFSVGSTIAVLVLVVVFGGTIALLIVFPMVSTALISAAAMTAVLLLRRSDSRATLAHSG